MSRYWWMGAALLVAACGGQTESVDDPVTSGTIDEEPPPSPERSAAGFRGCDPLPTTTTTQPLELPVGLAGKPVLGRADDGTLYVIVPASQDGPALSAFAVYVAEGGPLVRHRLSEIGGSATEQVLVLDDGAVRLVVAMPENVLIAVQRDGKTTPLTPVAASELERLTVSRTTTSRVAYAETLPGGQRFVLIERSTGIPAETRYVVFYGSPPRVIEREIRTTVHNDGGGLPTNVLIDVDGDAVELVIKRDPRLAAEAARPPKELFDGLEFQCR